LPEGVGILVASRGEPPTAYLPLVSRQRFAFLDAHEIRLTREETEAIVESRADLERSAIDALHEKSDGWAADSRLLVERARAGEPIETGRGADATEGAFRPFRRRTDGERIRARQRLPHRLGALPRTHPAAARPRAHGQYGDRGALLERLHRRNLFTVRRGSGAT
jgi:hypothetical protein